MIRSKTKGPGVGWLKLGFVGMWRWNVLYLRGGACVRTVAILGDDAQPDVGELGYKGAWSTASGVGVIDPWDEVPKDGERGGMEGGRRVRGGV